MSAALDLTGAGEPGTPERATRAVLALVRDVERPRQAPTPGSARDRRPRPGHRGTSNRDERGNSTDRRRRRAWLLATFGDGTTAPCYRCGVALDDTTLTVDRITPGRDGGTYARDNIRPACAADNSETGARLAGGRGRPLVIGVDPGPMPGIAIVRPNGTGELVQCSAALLDPVLRAIIATAPRLPGGPAVGAEGAYRLPDRTHAIVAVERYVVGPKSGRVSSRGANAATRNMVGEVEAIAASCGVVFRERPAATVKTWATTGDPARVERMGLSYKGMRHAGSAGWHAAYCAVHDAGHPDPLSARARRSPR